MPSLTGREYLLPHMPNKSIRPSCWLLPPTRLSKDRPVWITGRQRSDGLRVNSGLYVTLRISRPAVFLALNMALPDSRVLLKKTGQSVCNRFTKESRWNYVNYYCCALDFYWLVLKVYSGNRWFTPPTDFVAFRKDRIISYTHKSLEVYKVIIEDYGYIEDDYPQLILCLISYWFFFLTDDSFIFYISITEKEILVRIRYSFISTVRI